MKKAMLLNPLIASLKTMYAWMFILIVPLWISTADAQTFYCQAKVQVSHSSDGGIIEDQNGYFIFGEDDVVRLPPSKIERNWIVKKSSDRKLSISAGPGFPERDFQRSGNDLFFIEDCDGCAKTALLMENGPRPRMAIHWINLVSLRSELYSCVQTN